MSNNDKDTEFTMYGGIYNKESNKGIQAGRDININKSELGEDLSGFVKLIDKIEQLVSQADDIGPSEKRKLTEDLKSTKSSVTDPQPDAERALSRLNDVTKVLAKLAVIAGSAQKILPLAQQASSWLKNLF